MTDLLSPYMKMPQGRNRDHHQYRSMENLLAIERTAINAKYSFRRGWTKVNEVDLVHGKGKQSAHQRSAERAEENRSAMLIATEGKPLVFVKPTIHVGERPNLPNKQFGRPFRPRFKDFSDANRINQYQKANPIIQL